MVETTVDLHGLHIGNAAKLPLMSAPLNPTLGIVVLLTILVLKAKEIVTQMMNVIMGLFVAKMLVDLDILKGMTVVSNPLASLM